MIESLTGKTRKTDVSFFRNGLITISAYASRILQLEMGDVIDVAKDGSEYYLYVKHHRYETVGRHAATCYPSKRGSHNYRASSVKLCSRILYLVGRYDVARLHVGNIVSVDGKNGVVLIMRKSESIYD